MNAVYLIGALLALGALLLGWLVFSKKVPLPILFETGLASMVVGIIPMAIAAWNQTHIITVGRLTMVGIGFSLIAVSILKEEAKSKKSRSGPPRELDGRHFRHINGGRK